MDSMETERRASIATAGGGATGLSAARSAAESAAMEARRGSRSPSPTDRERLKQGRLAFERGDDAAALRHLGQLVAAGHRFADVHYLIGLIHERRDDLESAATSLREAIRINPAYVEALIALASVCERRGDFAQSQGLAERADQLSRAGSGGLDPTTRGKLANQQAGLADAFAAAGLRREAIEQYRQALERCPTFHDVRHRLAVTLREAGLPFQALQEFERILDGKPDLQESRIQLGLTCYAMGRTAEAVAAWREALALDPARREAAMYLRLIGRDETAVDAAPATAATAPGWSTRALASQDLGVDGE